MTKLIEYGLLKVTTGQEKTQLDTFKVFREKFPSREKALREAKKEANKCILSEPEFIHCHVFKNGVGLVLAEDVAAQHKCILAVIELIDVDNEGMTTLISELTKEGKESLGNTLIKTSYTSPLKRDSSAEII